MGLLRLAIRLLRREDIGSQVHALDTYSANSHFVSLCWLCYSADKQARKESCMLTISVVEDKTVRRQGESEPNRQLSSFLPLSAQVLLSLRLMLMMKPYVLSRVSREVAYGLHELLKTNAANIHCTDDWYTLFSLLECIGAGVKPPAALQVANTHPDIDTGDSFVSTHFQPFYLLMHLKTQSSVA